MSSLTLSAFISLIIELGNLYGHTYRIRFANALKTLSQSFASFFVSESKRSSHRNSV